MTSWSLTEPEFLDLREAPPAGSGEIIPHASASWLCNIRHWLIEKIAGKHMVIINAHISVIDRRNDRNIIGRMTNTGEGVLMQGSTLYCNEKVMLLLSNNAK